VSVLFLAAMPFRRVLAAALVPVALGACGSTATNGSDGGDAGASIDFFLQGVLAPPQGSTAGSCVFTDDPTQATLSMGILDVELASLFSNTYEAEFLAGNQFALTGQPTQAEIDADRIIVQGAAVTVLGPTGSTLASLSTHGASEVDPGSNGTPGYAPVTLTLIDAATIASLKSELEPFERMMILTKTQASGQTLGGQTVQSNVFQFPILVCRGCLVAFDTDSTVKPSPNCYGQAPTSSGTSFCFVGQDEVVDCHVCSEIDPFCLCGESACSTKGDADGGGD
jgi:hypothetical protein